MDKKELRVATYARVATEEQLKNMNEEEQKSVTENEMKSHLALLQIYQLEDNFKNKLSRLDNKIADNKVKAVIYTNIVLLNSKDMGESTLETGWTYLAIVMDLFDLKIIGWSYSRNMTSEIVIEAFIKPNKKEG